MFKSLLVCFLCVSASMAFAAKESLNLKQLVRRFVETSTVIQAADAKKESALATASKAGSGFFPTINLVGTKTETNYPDNAAVFGFALSDSTVYSVGLEAQQSIYTGGAVLQNYRQQKVLAEKAKLDFFGEKNQAIAVIVQAALEWISARDQLEVLKASIGRQKEFVAVTRKRQKRGAALSYELAQAEAEEIAFRPRIQNLERIKFDKEKQLQTALELPELPEIRLNWPKPIDLPKKKESEWVSLARQSRWDHYSAKLALKSAEVGKWVALSSDLPSVYLAGSYSYQDTELQGIVEEENQRHTFTINVSVPLFSGLSSVHQRRASQNLITAAERQLKGLNQDIESEIGRYLKNWRSTKLQVEQAERWASRAREAMRLGTKSYRVGRISSVQWLQLQRGLEAAELGRIQALQAHNLAVLQWQMGLGMDLEKFYSNIEI